MSNLFTSTLSNAFKALYSSKCYYDASKQEKGYGYGFGYIFLFSGIFLIPITALFIQQLYTTLYISTGQDIALTSKIEHVIEQLPTLNIENGKITNLTEDVIIHSDESEHIAIYITPTQTGPLTQIDASIVINQDHIIFRRTEKQQLPMPLTDVIQLFGANPLATYEADQNMIRNWLITMYPSKVVIMIAFYLLNLIALFLITGFKTVLFAVIISMGAPLFKYELSIPASLRIAALTGTAVMWCHLIALSTLRPIFSNQELIYFLMQAAFAFYALDSIKKHKKLENID